MAVWLHDVADRIARSSPNPAAYRAAAGEPALTLALLCNPHLGFDLWVQLWSSADEDLAVSSTHASALRHNPDKVAWLLTNDPRPRVLGALARYALVDTAALLREPFRQHWETDGELADTIASTIDPDDLLTLDPADLGWSLRLVRATAPNQTPDAALAAFVDVLNDDTLAAPGGLRLDLRVFATTSQLLLHHPTTAAGLAKLTHPKVQQALLHNPALATLDAATQRQLLRLDRAEYGQPGEGHTWRREAELHAHSNPCLDLAVVEEVLNAPGAQRTGLSSVEYSVGRGRLQHQIPASANPATCGTRHLRMLAEWVDTIGSDWVVAAAVLPNPHLDAGTASDLLGACCLVSPAPVSHVQARRVLRGYRARFGDRLKRLPNGATTLGIEAAATVGARSKAGMLDPDAPVWEAPSMVAVADWFHQQLGDHEDGWRALLTLLAGNHSQDAAGHSPRTLLDASHALIG